MCKSTWQHAAVVSEDHRLSDRLGEEIHALLVALGRRPIFPAEGYLARTFRLAGFTSRIVRR